MPEGRSCGSAGGGLGPRDGRVTLYPRSGVSQLLEPPPAGILEDPVQRCILAYLSRRGASFYLELEQAVYRLDPDLPKADLEAALLKQDPSLNLSGLQVTKVHALGKHLYIEFATGWQLRTHLGLYGSWHRYLPGASWQRPVGKALVVLETATCCLVCFNGSEARLLRTDGMVDRAQRARLGPDLSAASTDPAMVARTALELCDPDRPLVDLLLDQRVACGIGNVYKSELLFLHRLAPVTRLSHLDPGVLGALYGDAARLLRRNSGPGPRRTRFVGEGHGNLWVYRRAGRPCLRCGARIMQGKLGRHLRATYWCPRCQIAGGADGETITGDTT